MLPFTDSRLNVLNGPFSAIDRMSALPAWCSKAVVPDPTQFKTLN
jgi:hypothetical protein